MINLKDKNILFLCSWFPTRTRPHNGNFIFKHARCLVKEGIPITTLAVCEDTSMDERFEMIKGEEEGVDYMIVYYSYPFKQVKFLYKLMAYFRGLNSFWKEEGQIDLIHVNVLLDAGVIGWLLKIWKNIPYVLTEHSTIYLPKHPISYPKFLRPLIKSIIKKSSYILPVSENLKIHLSEIYSRAPYKVIPNVVDTDLFSPGHSREEIIKFLHVSTFTDQKNIVGLLNGFKKVYSSRKDLTLTLAGDGDIEELRRKVEKMNFPPEMIHVFGKLTEKEVATKMKEHDVFVLFSNHENLPCVLVEAQSCGLPIITTDVGGCVEIVDSKGLGEVIQAEDEEGLAEAIIGMINNIEKYDIQRIRDRAISRYSDKSVAKSFMSTYEGVLCKK
jgi:glycosyltransferase involved in cell wall biosynthesis